MILLKILKNYTKNIRGTIRNFFHFFDFGKGQLPGLPHATCLHVPSKQTGAKHKTPSHAQFQNSGTPIFMYATK